MENQNSQPDYSFILNQPGSQPPVMPKKSKKKFIVAGIVAGIVLLGTMALAMVAANQAKNTKSQKGTPAAMQAPISASNPVEQLLLAVRSQDYTKAANLLPFTSDDPEGSAKNVQDSFKGINLAGCKVSPLSGDRANSFSSLTCPSDVPGYSLKVNFQVVQEDKAPIIANYSMMVVKS